MIGLGCEDEAKFRAVHDKAMSLGSKSQGEPGARGDREQYYGACFRDLDGNEPSAFTMTGRGPAPARMARLSRPVRCDRPC